MRIPTLLALLALASCDDKPAGRPTAAADQLWKLAPDGATAGIVVSPYAVGMLEDGTIAARDFIAKAGPELAPFKEQIEAWLANLGGANAKLADVGLVRDKGAALFFGSDGKLAVVVLPVADRAKFVERAGGKPAATPDGLDTIGDAACKLVDGKHYACARSEALLGTLGKGALAAQLVKAGARGDLEVVADKLPLGEQPSTLVAVATIERGQLVARGVILKPPAPLLKLLEAPPMRPRTSIGKSSGFAIIDLRNWLGEAPPQPIVEGVTFADVVKTLSGPLTVNIPAGEHALELEQPLSDAAPVQKVLAQCDKVAALADFAPKLVDGACRIRVPGWDMDLDLWIEDGKLRAAKKDAPVAGKTVPFSPPILEMATNQWSFAMWGRGTPFASSGKPPSPTPSNIPAVALAPMRATSTINEAGFAMRKETTKDGDQIRFLFAARTVFANPPAVVDKLATIPILDTIGNNAWPKAKPIAEAHAGTPFAHDYASGQLGLRLAEYLIAGASNLIQPLVFGAPQANAPAEQTPGMLTQGAVRQYANRVYPEYVKANPTKPCPTMAELAAFVSPDATTEDEWGKPLVVQCKDLPAGVPFGIVSLGPDGQPSTPDDIKSY